MEELINNALQFTDTRTPVIKVTTYEDKDFITLSVQDNGLGMDLNIVKSQLLMFRKIFHSGFNTKGIG